MTAFYPTPHCRATERYADHPHRPLLAGPVWLTLLTALCLTWLVSAPARAAGQQIFDGLNGPVYATAVGADGTTYVGGSFTAWGPQTGGGAALAVADGALNRTLPPVAGTVYAVAPDGVGGWYLGGTFSHVGGVPRLNLAHILGTGAVDPNWNPGANSQVTTLAVAGGTVYAGGGFTQAGGGTGATSRNFLAAFDPGGNLTAWNPGANSSVYALAVAGGTVYAGGYFTQAGGGTGTTPRNHLAAFDATGSGAIAPTAWNPGANNTVYALAVTDGTVYVAGEFTQAGGGTGTTSRSRLAAFDSSGNLTAWNPGANNYVLTLAVASGTVYAGGWFTGAGGGTGTTPRNYLAAFDAAGSGAIAPTDWNPGTNNVVYALTVTGGTVYAGGAFTQAGGGGGATLRNRLAAFDAAGSGTIAPTTWNPGANGIVWALAVAGSTIYAGGQFTGTGISTTTRNRLAAFDSSGNLTAWNPGANGIVRALAVADGTVYAGGEFTLVGGGTGTTLRNYLAAFDATGSGAIAPAAWNPGANSIVWALAVANGTVYAGGFLTQAGGGTGTTPRSRLAAFDSSGNLTAWNPGANGIVRALAVADGTVYAGGEFTQAGGGTGTTLRNYLAAFDAAGSGAIAPTAWNPGADYAVYALAVANGTVYAGGLFFQAGGGTGTTPRNKLAAFDAAGSGAIAPTAWNPGANSTVLALAIANGTVYAGGGFNRVGGGTGTTLRNRLAAFDAAGSGTIAPTAWNPGANGIVQALAVANGTVYAGGEFTQAGGDRNSPYPMHLAAFDLAGTPSAPTQATVVRGDASGTVTWTAPSDTGASAITAYQLQQAPGPNYSTWTNATTSGDCLTLTCTVTGLTNGVRYEIRVRAVNAQGAGPWSVASQWFVPAAPSANPDVPTGLTGTPGNASITATWIALGPGQYGTGATSITSYRLFVLSGSTLVKFCNTASPSCTVTGLANGSPYTLRVRAFNNLGKYSDLSAPAGPYTPGP